MVVIFRNLCIDICSKRRSSLFVKEETLLDLFQHIVFFQVFSVYLICGLGCRNILIYPNKQFGLLYERLRINSNLGMLC